eukprot:8829682-Karenia_brevis.AAC.1
MSQERADWRRRLREGYEESSQRTRDFNRDMDSQIDQYIAQIDNATNHTRGLIAGSLKHIAKFVREHDDGLDRMRN